MEDIIRIIELQADQKNFKQVKKIVLEIGELSCVEPSALEFCFSVVSKDTMAESASLEIINIPGMAQCLDCNQEIKYSSLYSPCPRCNHYNLKKISGDELRVKNLIVI